LNHWCLAETRFIIEGNLWGYFILKNLDLEKYPFTFISIAFLDLSVLGLEQIIYVEVKETDCVHTGI
jgi:hypothetical protein